MSRMIDDKPAKITFCCAPLIFRCLDPSLLFTFQEIYPQYVLEELELSDTECDKYVEADKSHFGILAIPENRHVGEIRLYSCLMMKQSPGAFLLFIRTLMPWINHQKSS